MSDDEIQTKFMTMTTPPLPEARAGAIWKMREDLPDDAPFGRLSPLVYPQP